MPAPLRFRVWHDGAMHWPTAMRFDFNPLHESTRRALHEDAGPSGDRRGIVMHGPGTPTLCLHEAGYYLDPEAEGTVVMQSTGLSDVDGREIYEGDVVAWPDESIYVVEWETDEEGVGFRFPASAYGDSIEDCRVVGNIHEHPHLRP